MKIFIHENVSENIVCEMAAIVSRGDELIMDIINSGCSLMLKTNFTQI